MVTVLGLAPRVAQPCAGVRGEVYGCATERRRAEVGERDAASLGERGRVGRVQQLWVAKMCRAEGIYTSQTVGHRDCFGSVELDRATPEPLSAISRTRPKGPAASSIGARPPRSIVRAVARKRCADSSFWKRCTRGVVLTSSALREHPALRCHRLPSLQEFCGRDRALWVYKLCYQRSASRRMQGPTVHDAPSREVLGRFWCIREKRRPADRILRSFWLGFAIFMQRWSGLRGSSGSIRRCGRGASSKSRRCALAESAAVVHACQSRPSLSNVGVLARKSRQSVACRLDMDSRWWW